MYSDIFQDWTTISGNDTTESITQSEVRWGDFQAYSDIILYTECKLISKGGASQIKLFYETAPTKDEALFSILASVSLDTGPVVVNPILLSQAPSIPLSRWVRWRVAPEGTPTESWIVTFRSHIAARAVGVL